MGTFDFAAEGRRGRGGGGGEKGMLEMVGRKEAQEGTKIGMALNDDGHQRKAD